MYNLNKKIINNAFNFNIKEKYKITNTLMKQRKHSIKNVNELNKQLNGYDSLEYITNTVNKTSRQCKIVTGGIGDFIALDYLYNFSLNYDLIFISTHSLALKKIMNYYHKNNYFAFYFNFDIMGKPGFDTTEELIKNIPEIRFIKNIDFINISNYFPFLSKKLLIQPPEKQKYLNYHIFDVDKSDIIEKFNLPNNIAFISPYSKNLQINCINCNNIHETTLNCNLTRNFTYLDYLNTVEILKKNKLIGIIISVNKVILPDELSSYFINLSETLDIIEAIELLKKCKYFIGVDSCFSTFATKILKNENIIIKSNNKHLYIFKKIYYYPNFNAQIKSFI